MAPSPVPDAQAGAFQRHISALEAENARLTQLLTKKRVRSHVHDGRGIRRLVCLTEPISDLIAEYDRRVMLADDDSELALQLVDSTEEQDRIFRSYQKLYEWIPPIRGLMQASTEGYVLAVACQELKRGADTARGDDTHKLKNHVATWLNEQQPHPEPLLCPNSKVGRGFNNDATGRYLCPVDYNWFDPTIRHAIKHYHSLYPVTGYSWPAFFYRNGEFDATRPTHGLFKGELLVRAFKCVFTSPSSAREKTDTQNDNPDDEHFKRTQRKPKTNVATLLRMRSVQPRAIAYIAVQLRFALSNVSSWDAIDDNFDYQVLYDNVVDWFESPATPARAQEIEELLRWWNNDFWSSTHCATSIPRDWRLIRRALQGLFGIEAKLTPDFAQVYSPGSSPRNM